MRISGESFLERVFAILEAAAAAPTGLTLAALTDRVGLPKPTVFRILRSLVALGYLEEAEAGGYQVAPRLFSLVPPGNDDFLRACYLPVVQSLHDRLDETINLGRMEGLRVRYVHILESTQPLRWSPDERVWDEALRTALGRAMVAYWAPEALDDLLPSLMERAGYGEVDRIRSELAQTRERGWAEESEENCAGVCCIAVPLLRKGECVAAISVSVPQIRTIGGGRDRIIEELLEAASGAVAQAEALQE